MRSFGVEEEFLLVDPKTGRTVPAAAEVLAAAAGGPPMGDGAGVHPELSGTQVEAATAPCRSLAELTAELTRGRCLLASAARAAGVWLVPSGTPVLGGATAPAEHTRFAEIAARYLGMVRGYQACGCHVHVAVPDRETAVAVVNHLRPWLPTLLALSANSPFHDGFDTGYASWRMIEQSRFPGAGVPPWFGSAAEYAARVDQLVEQGVLLDDAMTFWLARPSPRLPTVELRVADVAVDVTGAVLQAALSRALVLTALADLERGREARRDGDDEGRAAAAVWSAARYGLAGHGVHPVLAHRSPATDLLDELVTRVTPALDAAGDLDVVRELIAEVLRGGTGAERQRAAAAGGMFGVVRFLAIGDDDAN